MRIALNPITGKFDLVGFAGLAGNADAADVTYTPAVPADWDGSADPGNVDAALDQLAERVTDVEGGGTDVTLDVNADTLLSLTGQELGLDVQAAHKVLIGRVDAGVDTVPTWRVLDAADMPDLSGVYQPLDATLTSIAGLGTAADKMLYTTGVDTWAEAAITAAGRAILDDATVGDQRTTLGLVAAGAGDIWVEKAGDTMTGQLFIDGGADAIQLRVQGNGTQTGNIFNIENSAGTVLAGADSRGVLFSNGGTIVSNVFIGSGAGRSAASGGDSNLAIGYNALDALTDGTRNVAIGADALGACQGGDYNMAVGRAALQILTSGQYNVAVGDYSLSKVTTHEYNVAIGQQAGKNAASSNSVFIGGRAGESVTSGANMVIIGAYAGLWQTTTSNIFIIDNQLRANAAAEITNAMFYGIFAATPASQSLRVNGLLKPTIAQTTTNAVIEVSRLQAEVSTAATGGAAGFGVGQSFYAETATDATYQQQGLISTAWIDAANATRKAKMSLSAYDTAARLGMEIEASGSAVMLGFFGVTPIVRPTTGFGAAAFAQNSGNAVNDASTFDGYTLLQVISALRTIGLLT